MEHRKEARLKADQRVLVTPLGLLGMPAMSGSVLDISGSGLRLRVPNPVPCGSPVKVETAHIVAIGEVSRCDEVGGAYDVGLMLLHSTAHVPTRP